MWAKCYTISDAYVSRFCSLAVSFIACAFLTRSAGMLLITRTMNISVPKTHVGFYVENDFVCVYVCVCE